MRMAMVEVIGALIKELSEEGGVEGGGGGGEGRDGKEEGKERKLTGLFELLMERFLDLSSYVRAKVINTLSKLWEYVSLPSSHLPLSLPLPPLPLN
jgi:condensin complex subunit 1